MYRVGFHQPYIPVNSRTTVPAWVWLFWIIHFYRQHILLFSKIKEGGQVVFKRDVPVGADTKWIPVDKNLAVHVNAVEPNVDFFWSIFGRQRKDFPVPSDASG